MRITKKLREFHRIAVAHQSQCVFIVNHLISRSGKMHRMPNGQTYNTNFAPYHKVVKQVAKKLNAPSIDLPQIMQSQNVSVDSLVSEDGLHLSVEGNHLYTSMVFKGLKQFLRD